MTEEEIRQIVRDEMSRFPLFRGGKLVFERPMQVLDGRNIKLGITTGTKIGTATNQKIGFFNKAPVVQQTVSTVGAGGAASDGTARGGVDAIIAALQNLGLFA